LGHRQPGTGRTNRQSGTRPWIASKAWRSTSLSFSPNRALPVAPKAAAARPVTSTHVRDGPGGFLRDLVPVRMSVHAGPQ
jgi:hypothetical protein